MRLLNAIAVLAFAMPLAAQKDCQPVFDALNKVMSTPTHIYTTTTTDGTPRTTETIYSTDGIYTNETGKWVRSKATLKELTKEEEESRRSSVNVCKSLKDESVNGEAATVYSYLSTTASQRTEAKISISKSKKLPLRNEVDLETGEKGTRSHYSVRYDYKNVSAPLSH